MTTETVVLDLPPAPSAYVETTESLSAVRCDGITALDVGDCHRLPPGEPPHHNVRVDEPAPRPLEINVSDTLHVSEGFDAVLIPAP